MAFQLKGNIFNNNTGSPLSNKCIRYGKDPNSGKRICLEEERTATRKPQNFSTDPAEKERQIQWIKDNPEEYKRMIGETKTQRRSRDTKDGSTSVVYEGKPRNFSAGFANAYGLVFDSETPTWQEQAAKMKASSRFQSLDKNKRRKVIQVFKDKFLEENPGVSFKPISRKRKITTKETPGSVSEWSDFN